MKTALYTTMYPGAERYVSFWYESVVAQSDKGFDLWIGLDGIARREVQDYAGAAIAATWLENDEGGTPSTIRSKAFRALTESYDYIILTDADDVLAETRVEAGLQALERSDVAGCALRLINQNGDSLDRVFMPEPGVAFDDLLPVHNVFGLSNTAYRADALRRGIPIPDDCVLSDWFLATQCWCFGARLDFNYEPLMYYRQHDKNTAGVCPPFSADQVLQSTRLVLKHYSIVLTKLRSVTGPKTRRIESAARRAQMFGASVTDSEECLAEYVEALNLLEPKYVWWWCVANPELEYLWKK